MSRVAAFIKIAKFYVSEKRSKSLFDICLALALLESALFEKRRNLGDGVGSMSPHGHKWGSPAIRKVDAGVIGSVIMKGICQIHRGKSDRSHWLL